MARAEGTYFATCSPGLEPVLHAELKGLGVSRLERQVGGVRFDATEARGWEANLRLRTAIRVLWRLGQGPCRDADELYARVGEVDWTRFLRPEGRLWIDARVRDSALTHSRFAAQRAKDAIVDQLRARRGDRPEVGREGADLGLDVHLVRDRLTLSLDTSGGSLHRRGWRRHQGLAPLSECIAAGMVALSEWDERAPFIDPFCGTGTLLVEAGWVACGRAPGLLRREPFGFERWLDHDARAFEGLRDRVASEGRPMGKRRLIGRDVDPDRVAEAREHLGIAGLEGAGVEVELGSATDFDPRPGWNAWYVTNPPYGERIGANDDLRAVHMELGALLREKASGSHLALLSGDNRLTKALGLKFHRRISLPNGGLDTELVLADLK